MRRGCEVLACLRKLARLTVVLKRIIEQMMMYCSCNRYHGPVERMAKPLLQQHEIGASSTTVCFTSVSVLIFAVLFVCFFLFPLCLLFPVFLFSLLSSFLDLLFIGGVSLSPLCVVAFASVTTSLNEFLLIVVTLVRSLCIFHIRGNKRIISILIFIPYAKELPQTRGHRLGYPLRLKPSIFVACNVQPSVKYIKQLNI